MVLWLIALSPAIKAIHIIACIVLIVSVLLQAGKGTGLGAAFGVGASQTVFGAQGGAKFLSRLTMITALFFTITAMALALVARYQTLAPGVMPSAVDQAESAPAETVPVPASPAPVEPAVNAPAEAAPSETPPPKGVETR